MEHCNKCGFSYHTKPVSCDARKHSNAYQKHLRLSQAWHALNVPRHPLPPKLKCIDCHSAMKLPNKQGIWRCDACVEKLRLCRKNPYRIGDYDFYFFLKNLRASINTGLDKGLPLRSKTTNYFLIYGENTEMLEQVIA